MEPIPAMAEEECPICKAEFGDEDVVIMHCMHKYHAVCLGELAEFEQVPRRRMLDDLKCPLCKRRGKDLTAAYQEVVSNTRCAGMVGSPREIVVDASPSEVPSIDISDAVIDDAVDEVSPGQPRPPSPVCAKAKALSKPPSKATQFCRNKAKARGKAFARHSSEGQKPSRVASLAEFRQRPLQNKTHRLFHLCPNHGQPVDCHMHRQHLHELHRKCPPSVHCQKNRQHSRLGEQAWICHRHPHR